MRRKSREYVIAPAEIVALAMATYVVVLCTACYEKFIYYGYGDFDLAVHAQSIRNILHGSIDSSIFGISFLGNHMVLILFLVAPLYALFPSPLMLLHLQTLALALGAWGIYKTAKVEIPKWWAAALSIIYLAYPPLIHMNLYEFHPIALAVPLLIWALCFHKSSRFAPFAVCLGLAILCQENVPLIAVGFAFYSLLEHKRGRWFWAPLVAGLVYFVLAVFVVMPRLNHNIIQFTTLYKHLGGSLPEVFKNMLLHPVATAGTMVIPEKLTFLNALLAPVAYVSLLSPLSFAPGILVIAQRLLSARLSEFTIVYHYQAEFIPFIFFAAIFGIKRALNINHRLVKPVLGSALVCLPLIAFFAGGVPGTLRHDMSPGPEQREIRVEKDALVARLPANARILATFDFLPHLASHETLYSFHHVYSGQYTLSDVPYPTPQVDYILLDTRDQLTFSPTGFYVPNNYKRIQEILNNGNWDLTHHRGSVLALKRMTNAAPSRLPLVTILESTIEMNRNVKQAPPSATIHLAGFNIGTPDADNTVELTLCWRKESDGDKDYDMTLTLESGNTSLYHGVLSPGSRIWPPQSWPAGKLIADKHRIRLSNQGPSPGTVSVHVALHPLN